MAIAVARVVSATSILSAMEVNVGEVVVVVACSTDCVDESVMVVGSVTGAGDTEVSSALALCEMLKDKQNNTAPPRPTCVRRFLYSDCAAKLRSRFKYSPRNAYALQC